MINQYSFNLDAPQDYLVHGKLGAHYSKNWTKEKQNEYNKWYYKTHKDELAKKRTKYKVDNVQRGYRAAYEKHKETLARQNDEAAEHYISRHKDGLGERSVKVLSTLYDDAASYRKDAAEVKQYGRDQMNAYLKDVNKHKDSLTSKVRYDVETTAKKASNTAKTTAKKASNAVKNIKSSISSVANKVLNPDDGRKTLSEYGYKKAKKNTKQISDRISFTTYD